ncbi:MULTISPECIES: ATP-binding cassette domain-containing protein [Paenibacillus]|uniref:ABC transporter ATP-binding protein n=1 Tax=Paenibacillus albilobatus TaxID=2716884 RepID=A0A919XEG9_9BACL|nr:MULTISPECIES: ABC transporter ATP-binding protein [Paenibacillus]GIO29903.1 ABC transporter ATP-binding protein [Paenibacillus albilobatus]
MADKREAEGRDDGLVILRDTVKTYNGRNVLHNISLKVRQGECIALIGKNGSGKSTLLRLLAGLSRPTSGTRTVPGGSLRIGYVPERFPPIVFTPWEFLSSAAAVRGLDKRAAEEELSVLLRQLDMEHAMHVKMNQFSKGMLQKISLIQAIAGKPDLLLLDEPLSGLDVKAQENLLHVLLAQKRSGTAIVMSVHESKLIERAADRVLLIQEGRIVKETREVRRQPGAVAQVSARIPGNDALAEIAALPGVANCTPDSDVYLLQVEEDSIDQVLRIILDRGGSVLAVIPAEGIDARMGERLQAAAR